MTICSPYIISFNELHKLILVTITVNIRLSCQHSAKMQWGNYFLFPISQFVKCTYAIWCQHLLGSQRRASCAPIFQNSFACDAFSFSFRSPTILCSIVNLQCPVSDVYCHPLLVHSSPTFLCQPKCPLSQPGSPSDYPYSPTVQKAVLFRFFVLFYVSFFSFALKSLRNQLFFHLYMSQAWYPV